MKSEKVDFTLNPNGLKSIPLDKYEMNFTFVIDDKRYPTSRIIADLLSPKIRKLHFIDESIQEFYIHTDDSKRNIVNNDDYFTEFLQLCNFEEFHLDNLHRELFSNYFLKLGNIEEYFKLHGAEMFTESPEKAVEYLISIEKFLLENSEEIDCQSDHLKEIILYISKHFYEISTDKLKNLTPEILHEIVSSESLVVKDEDSLLETVLKLYENDHSYSALFSSIAFSNLSEKSVESFISRFSIDDITREIWETICTRLVDAKKVQTINGRYLRKENSIKEFKLENGHEFEGIMKHLTNETGGNIHDNGTIEISSNSIICSYHPKNLVDYQSNSYYW